MRNATKRSIKDHPHLSWEALPEGVACVEIAKQVQEEVDSEAFLASLPKRLREVLELRLAGYSWAEAAQRFGVKASTFAGIFARIAGEIRGFFGYDPSNGVLNR
jgi:DNA-directed RNA polymerase specialized sigma24 family protein